MGSICLCPAGYETRNDSNYKKCEDIDECALEGSCQQLCANTRGGYNCACAPGYFRSGRKMCKAWTREYAKVSHRPPLFQSHPTSYTTNHFDDYFVCVVSIKVCVTNAQSMLISNLEGTRIRTLRKQTMRWVTAFDFHNQTGRVYWADWKSKSIYSSFENGSDVIKIVSSGVSIAESIAVDWIGQNLYWSDYVMQHIEVSKLDGKRRRILFNVCFSN